MDRWIGKIAVVTGASDGIGLSTAQTLVKEGMIVVGLARRKEIMEAEAKKLTGAKGKFYALHCDVSKETDVIQSFKWIKENLGNVQVLINNAGYVKVGGFSETTSETWDSIMAVNVMGSVYCATQAIKYLQESKLDGHIININSVLGHRIYKFFDSHFNIYAATKHAITGFTESLMRELLGQNIRVTSISPGLVATNIVSGKISPASIAENPIIHPKDVADAIVYVIGTPQRVQITELTIRPLGEKTL